MSDQPPVEPDEREAGSCETTSAAAGLLLAAIALIGLIVLLHFARGGT